MHRVFHIAPFNVPSADIQEFYESTLLDESKTSHEKTLETLRIASKWERDQPFTHSQPKAEVSGTAIDLHVSHDFHCCFVLMKSRSAHRSYSLRAAAVC